MTTDAHTAGLEAVVAVARSAVGALRSATEDMQTDPKQAAKAVLTQAALVSKSLSQIGRRLDQLPAPDAPADAGPTVSLPDLQEALTRLRSAAQDGLCPVCCGVLPNQ